MPHIKNDDENNNAKLTVDMQSHSNFKSLDVQVGEVGELSEIFQWRGEVGRGLPNWEDAEKEHLGEELSDVLLYLIRLADICGIDLGDAATKKIVKNAIKYPPKPRERKLL